MKRHIFDCRFLHYALLVALLAAATAGGFVLLGCFPTETQDATVVDPTQKHPEGGVKFSRSDTRESARVNLLAEVKGHPVRWIVGNTQDSAELGRIPDPAKSNQVEILRTERPTHIHFLGQYTRDDGSVQEILTLVRVGVEN